MGTGGDGERFYSVRAGGERGGRSGGGRQSRGGESDTAPRASVLLPRLPERRTELGREAPVHAEDLLVHDGRHGQAVEAVGEGLPQLDVVPPLACERQSSVIVHQSSVISH